jgi:transposase
VQEKRLDYIEALEHIDPNDIIVLDESGSDLRQTSDYSRAEGGKRAKAAKPHWPGEKFSIMGAISMSCILAVMYIDCAINGDIFKTFIEKMLLKKLKPGQFVVMDNIAFHKQPIIKSLIESRGAKVVFLPPYSPDLSPIEKMWSKVKEIIKRKKPRSKAEFHDALFIALSSVNEDDLESWYEDCGYAVA